MIIESQKHLFDIPEDISYLNNAYMSPLMHRVVKAMEAGMSGKIRPWTYTAQDFFTPVERGRELAAQIYGTQGDNIAIVPSASYGLQIAANALPIAAGKSVIVLEDQFPSNIYPWQDKIRRQGGRLMIVPSPKDDDWTQALLTAINSETAIVAIPQTHWASGATIDLARIRTALDEVGGALALDLTQSLGAQPFDMASIRPDFAVSATYKWLMGPYSLGFLYIDPKWHGAEPLEHNWINRAGSEDFAGLTRYRAEFQPGARRFDMGEKSNASQLMGANAAMEQILDWGIDNIAETLRHKTDMVVDGLSQKKITPVAANLRAPHYLGLRFAQGIPEGLMQRLADQNIYISIRGSAMRVTPHLYSTEADISRLIHALNDI